MKICSSKTLTFFHFNDVYDLIPKQKQPKAGAAYFCSLLKTQQQKYNKSLTFFSGDAFSPSLLSRQFKGQNMIKPLQSMGIDLACYGNHDLDYELEHCLQLTRKTGFPWLMSNIYDNRTGRRLAEGLQTYKFEVDGYKIGVFNLGEQEWIKILSPSYHQIIKYIPFQEFAQKMVDKLRNKQNCDIVIALTHMMKSNDIKLARNIKGIDIIMGGHDHLFVHEQIQDTILVKSDSDFKCFSKIRMWPNQSNKQNENKQDNSNIKTFVTSKWTYELTLMEVNHKLHQIKPDPIMHDYIESIYSKFKQKLERIAILTTQDIDLRSQTIRAKPSAFLEIVSELYRIQTDTDIAFCVSGGFRAQNIIPSGKVSYRSLINLIQDSVVTINISGKNFKEMLEHSVSGYPGLYGRFGAISGVNFTWDCSVKAGNRVLTDEIFVGNDKLDEEKIYKVALEKYVSQGGDGYTCLKGCKRTNYLKDSTNTKIIYDLADPSSQIMKQFIKRYPQKASIKNVEGKDFVQLGNIVPERSRMISSNVYQIG